MKKKFGVSQKVENPKLVSEFLDEICINPPKEIDDLEKKKRNFAARKGGTTILNRDLIAIIKQNPAKKLPDSLAKILQKRSVRTISGVTPIGILTKPYGCPGRCVYCPTDWRMPKSYLPTQPAAARALRNNFHPHKQVINRIKALEDSGHPVSKLEIIVMGGTWSFLPTRYQSWYLKNVFDAANGEKSRNLAEAQKKNETAKRRIIGLTLETRPDYINPEELLRMRRYGCTRIEIGVQTIDDEISELTKRDQPRVDVVTATKLMRDFGFKFCYHLMPGLPGSTPAKDLVMLREIFENPEFKPDFVKIYPCQVLPQSELAGWWKKGKFEPLHDVELIKLLLKMKEYVPSWTRIMRLLRDIPVGNILSGAKFSNLRQIMKDQPGKLREVLGDADFDRMFPTGKVNWPCKCIRCREVGFAKDLQEGDIQLVRRDYDASDGKEVFLSFESADHKTIYALLRLRNPSKEIFAGFHKSLHNSAFIREVHSYGAEISVDDKDGKSRGQHRGLGTRLIHEAENIAKNEWGRKKMVIIAGIGTREYYKKFGYKLSCTYMVKSL